MQLELFGREGAPTVLRGFALPCQPRLLAGLEALAGTFRHMQTPGGHTMSVALTSCGSYGWCSDRRGYRYDPLDPETGRPWPPMPPGWPELARAAAEAAGFPGFEPDAVLVNRYEPGARLSLHQDKNERDFSQPIVSVSLGLPATFLFGGHRRTSPTARIPLAHGDVVVWGGPDRLRYHGVSPLKPGQHPLLGGVRINLTFRRALTRFTAPTAACYGSLR